MCRMLEGVYKSGLPWPDKHQPPSPFLSLQLLSFFQTHIYNTPTSHLSTHQTRLKWTLSLPSTSLPSAPPPPGLRKSKSPPNTNPVVVRPVATALLPKQPPSTSCGPSGEPCSPVAFDYDDPYERNQARPSMVTRDTNYGRLPLP